MWIYSVKDETNITRCTIFKEVSVVLRVTVVLVYKYWDTIKNIDTRVFDVSFYSVLQIEKVY